MPVGIAIMKWNEDHSSGGTLLVSYDIEEVKHEGNNDTRWISTIDMITSSGAMHLRDKPYTIVRRPSAFWFQHWSTIIHSRLPSLFLSLSASFRYSI